MKWLNTILILCLLICFKIDGNCYTRIYLISDAEISKENLIVSDICKMEGANLDHISNLVISPDLYRDNVVDAKELYDFLSLTLNDKLFIFGSGVRITKKTLIKEIDLEKTIVIQNGDFVDLSIKKMVLLLKLKGKALKSGCENDEINLRLSTGKIVKGRIISLKKVDVIL